jgi:hypothetical protein
MLHFKARRRNPTASPELTASQRRIMKIMGDAMQEVRAQVIRDEAKILDTLRHGPESKIPNLVTTDPWYKAQGLVEAELLSELIDAGKRTGSTFPKIQKATLSYRFDAERPDSAAWAQKEAGNLIREISQEQQTMVRDYVSRSQMGEFTVTQVARNLRDVVGLTSQQSGWVDNFRERFIQDRLAQGDPIEQAIQRAIKPTERYQARIHKYRTETIARTEILRASNEGRNQAWRQGIEEGYISPAAQKQWQAEFDACEICLPLDGESVPITGDFPDGDPPLHPNCRCDVIMVDVDVTEYEDMSWDEIDSVLDELLGENTVERPAKQQNSFDDLMNNAQEVQARSFKRSESDGERLLQELYDIADYNGKPKLLTKTQLDAEIQNGAIEVFRGVVGETDAEAKGYIRDYKTGTHYAGRGIYGNGTYTSTWRETALSYSSGDESNVMRMALSKDAKVITYEEARKATSDEFLKVHDAHMKKVSEINQRGGDRGELQEELEQYDAQRALIDDPGYWAVMNGYDAMTVSPGSPNEKYYVVFNRGKMMVEDEG